METPGVFPGDRKKLLEALEWANAHYGHALKRLAE